jgi:hypothetical protein
MGGVGFSREQQAQYQEKEDRDGPRNVSFSPLNQLTRLVAREFFYHTKLP